MSFDGVTSPKHRAIGFNGYKMGEEYDGAHGAKAWLHLPAYGVFAQREYDHGWMVAVEGGELVAPVEIDEPIEPKPQGDLFG